MIEALYYIGLSQALFVAIVLLTKKSKQNSDFVLVFWLFTIAFKFVVLLVSAEHGDFFDDQFSTALIPLTFGPFLFIYTKSLIYRKHFFKHRDYLHFIPFVLLTALYFIFFKGELNLSGEVILRTDGFAIPRIFYSACFAISISYYTVFTFYLLRRYRQNLTDNFSYFSADNELNWLYFLASFFALTYIVYTSLGLYNLIAGVRTINVHLISDIGLTLLTFSVSYFGLTQPYLFKETDEIEMDDELVTIEKDSSNKSKEKYRQSNLSEATKKEYILHLKNFMKDEKPYLDPELTVQDLSKQVNIARHHLTEILNNDIGKNFFTFINEYRVNEVKRRLLDEKFDHLTIIAIAFDCGFNSKSTFNSIFKQNTEMTPSKWKVAQKK